METTKFNKFWHNLQEGRYDRTGIITLAILEIVASAVLLITVAGGCSTATTPCSGASCQNLANADGGASSLDGSASGEAGKGDSNTPKQDSFKADTYIAAMCDLEREDLPPELECFKCIGVSMTSPDDRRGCNAKQTAQCTNNPWIKAVPGLWKRILDTQWGGKNIRSVVGCRNSIKEANCPGGIVIFGLGFEGKGSLAFKEYGSY